jgi:hypothetical protein
MGLIAIYTDGYGPGLVIDGDGPPRRKLNGDRRNKSPIEIALR